MLGVSNQECKRLGLSCGRKGGREGGGWRFLSEWVLLREGQPRMSLRVFLGEPTTTGTSSLK